MWRLRWCCTAGIRSLVDRRGGGSSRERKACTPPSCSHSELHGVSPNQSDSDGNLFSDNYDDDEFDQVGGEKKSRNDSKGLANTK